MGTRHTIYKMFHNVQIKIVFEIGNSIKISNYKRQRKISRPSFLITIEHDGVSGPVRHSPQSTF